MNHTDTTNSVLAEQNDRFRKSVLGQAVTIDPPGRAVLSANVAALSHADRAAIIERIINAPQFGEEIDPCGTREMGKVEVNGNPIWFKIDYYDIDYSFGSPDPTDSTKTRRVLTILFPDEW